MRQAGRRAALGVLVGMAAAGTAQASGYALREQSAAGLGNAFAGSTAAAEDVSFMFFNPATLGRLDGHAASLALTWAAPRAKLEEAAATTGAGTPITGDDRDDDIAEDALIPALYGMVPFGERVRLGLGITTPFGLATEYPDDWVGRYHAVESELMTVNVNPALGVRVTDWLSFGFGFQAQYADGELSNAVDFGTIGAGFGVPGAVPGAQDGFAKLEGDDWTFGYTAGVLVEPVAGTRLGAAFRSQIEHTLEGEARFRGDAAGVTSALQAAGLFRDTDARLDLTTPASLSFGIHQQVTPRFALMAEAQWTEWSEFDELRIEFDNPAQPDSVSEERWNDTWFFALGATWTPLDTLTLRAGIAYDESPTSSRYRTPRVPDENRTWLAFGASWQPRPWLGLDLGYTHIWVNDSRVDLSGSDAANAARGSLTAQYENSIDMVTAGLRLRF